MLGYFYSKSRILLTQERKVLRDRQLVPVQRNKSAYAPGNNCVKRYCH